MSGADGRRSEGRGTGNRITTIGLRSAHSSVRAAVISATMAMARTGATVAADQSSSQGYNDVNDSSISFLRTLDFKVFYCSKPLFEGAFLCALGYDPRRKRQRTWLYVLPAIEQVLCFGQLVYGKDEQGGVKNYQPRFRAAEHVFDIHSKVM